MRVLSDEQQVFRATCRQVEQATMERNGPGVLRGIRVLEDLERLLMARGGHPNLVRIHIDAYRESWLPAATCAE